MSGRVATALVIIAIGLGLIAWLFASRPEPTPASPASAPHPEPAPATAIAIPAPAGVGQVVEPPPAAPGSSVSAPPIGVTTQIPPAMPKTPAADSTSGAPHFQLDAGVRFPITAPGIRAAVQDAKPEMQQCYEEWLKANPALAGRLKIGFRITADGGPEAVVDQVHLVEDAGMGNVAFEGCVLSVMSGMRFDAPREGSLTVTYPLMFSNDGGPGAP